MKKFRLFKTIADITILSAIMVGVSMLSIEKGYSAPINNTLITQQLEKKITLKITNKSLKDILYSLQEKTGISFILKEAGDIDKYTNLSIDVKEQTVAQILEKLLTTTPLTYVVSNNTVVIKERALVTEKKQLEITITGIILEEDGKTPIPGATIAITGTTKGAITGLDGRFTLKAPKGASAEVEFTGKISQNFKIDDRTEHAIILKNDNIAIEEVVVNGIFTRKAESYAGSSVTMTAKDLARVGNQNIIQSLKNLDPSLYVLSNLTAGSNPNYLPEMQMRGQSSLPNEVGTSLKGNYQNKPNQPLFILDGFEASIEKIFDLDMNRVESVTLLKDAAAKALYGSKAANGVIVVETKRLAGNETRVTYTGSIDITGPDLSSYNLCNAEEKLRVEKIEGVYDGATFPIDNIVNWQLYDKRLKSIHDGLDTYWLSKPLRTGIGHKHALSVEMGDSRALRGVIDFSYNKNNGVMKGSDRETIQGSVSLSYRVKSLLFRNIMSVANVKSNESPYGGFDTYTSMNPYWKAIDNETGEYARWAETNIPNPLFDSTIGTLNKESYLNFTNNLYIEWDIFKGLKMTGRLGIDLKRSDSDEFLPSSHSSFTRYTFASNEERLNWGSYTQEGGKGSTVSADINLNYSKSINRHNFFVNARYNIADAGSSASQFRAEGFPGNMGANLTFARQYALNSVPSTDATLSREVGFLVVGGYTFDDKYLLDLTYSTRASSLFGKNNRWAPGWSVAMGWNIHKENFLKDSKVIEQLKVRGSVGVTGNQNFNTNQTITTYKYYTGVNYQGLVGSYMQNLANENLKWEQRKEYNFGADIKIKGLTAKFDYYNATTENMVTDVTISTATGFKQVKDNLGKVRNVGYELTLGYTIFQNKNGYFNISASGVTEKNYIVSLSDAMRSYNKQQEDIAADKNQSKPVLIYRDGQAMNTIWAVRSHGIDPATGDEVYIKQNGTLTNVYSSRDLVAAGINAPKYRGNVGFHGQYKGFGLSINCNFLAGGEMYNNTLVDRVENIDIMKQVDRRVLEGRWQYVGQNAQFKRLQSYTDSNTDKTQATTRFVQKRNEFDISSISVSYEFSRRMLQKTALDMLRMEFYMNDVTKFSSIQIERGLAYPFARTFSFKLTATF